MISFDMDETLIFIEYLSQYRNIAIYSQYIKNSNAWILSFFKFFYLNRLWLTKRKYYVMLETFSKFIATAD